MIHALFTKTALGIALLGSLMLSAGAVHAGEFSYDSASQSIELRGTIRPGDSETFDSLLRAHPETVSIKLSSSVGGEYVDSLAISLRVKRLGLDTVSANYCHSGCAYIWLAGQSRKVVGAANPEIHLPYANATGETYPKLTYAWLEALGYSHIFADAVVESVGPNNNFVKLTPGFLTKFDA